MTHHVRGAQEPEPALTRHAGKTLRAALLGIRWPDLFVADLNGIACVAWTLRRRQAQPPAGSSLICFPCVQPGNVGGGAYASWSPGDVSRCARPARRIG